MKSLADGRVALHAGDCLAALAKLAPDSVDSVVTDPPYHLQAGRRSMKRASPDAAQRARIGGFMAMKWDGGDIAFRPDVWREALRVLKPGGHLVAFAATRTYHRIAVAIEDAGFEIRDQLAWVYGQGSPKSLDVSKAIDKGAGAEPIATGKFKRASIQGNDPAGAFASYPEETKRVEITAPSSEAARAWGGWGTALKPAWEPIVLARKPLSERSVAANVLRWGTGAINVDACRIAGETPSVERRSAAAKSGNYGRAGDKMNGDAGRFRANGDREEGLANYLDGKDGDKLGRWPANLCHDGSPEVLEGFPITGPTPGSYHTTERGDRDKTVYAGAFSGTWRNGHKGPAGSAARFFYCAKASRAERRGSKHPTVKPVKLMRWLVRLITPPGGLVLDPFAGTGATAEAALAEGFRAMLIEREAQYRVDIARRLKSPAPSAERRAPSAGRLVYGRFASDAPSAELRRESHCLAPPLRGRAIGPIGLKR